MKTTNKIQKTLLTATVIAGLAFLGFSMYAQDETNSLMVNNDVKHFAMLTSRNITLPINISSKTTGLASTRAIAAFLVKEAEEPLNVEDWMLNEKTFGSNSVVIENETEEQLKLEDWMLNESGFSRTALIEEETENPLEVENWMLDENNFTTSTMVIETATDELLKLEDWMLDENHFNLNQKSSSVAPKENNKIFSTSTFFYREVNEESVLKIEDWMINPKIWSK